MDNGFVVKYNELNSSLTKSSPWHWIWKDGIEEPIVPFEKRWRL